MNRSAACIARLCVALALAGTPVLAAAKTASPPAKRTCCRVITGTVVMVQLVDEVSTRTQTSGDRFAIKLTEPMVVDGRIVLPAGTKGVGQVVEAEKPGYGGKSAKLVLAARYLTYHGRRIPLRGLQLSTAGRNNSMEAQAVGLTGIAFAPLGLVAFAVKGGDATIPSGAQATAKVANPVVLAPLGRAPTGTAPSVVDAADVADSAIEIPPPPTGYGQVVFFRSKSLLGTGQWFNVREDGKALGKLTNGAYFVQPLAPGVHTFTAKTEPEFNDKLKLEIDPGETYFVEGILTKGLVIGAADLTPSDRNAFAKASKTLKPAPAPEQASQDQGAAPATKN